MKSSTQEFPRNVRSVFTAVKHVMETCGRFKRVRAGDGTFVVTASHGMSLLSAGENVTVRVVATGTDSSRVVVESKSKIALNFINGGANTKNVRELTDYIANEVWKLLDVTSADQPATPGHSTIRLVKPNIPMRHCPPLK